MPLSISDRDRLELTAEVSSAVAKGGSLPDTLRVCAESLVRRLDGVCARIWTLNEAEQVLEQQASAGMCADLRGSHSRVLVDQIEIGQIAQARRPHCTNAAVGDPVVSDREWAAREGVVAFAGYPLLAGGQLIGVIAIFTRQPLSESDLRVMGAVADIVALGISRQRAEVHRRASVEALQNTTRQLNDAQRIAHVGHWEQNLDSGRITASDETYRIFGLTPPEGLPTWAAWQEHLHPEDRAAAAAAIAEALGAGPRYEAEYRIIRPDGDIRFIHSEGEVAHDEAGRLRRLFGIVQDVTERRRAEAALRAAEQRLQHVVAFSPAVLLILELEGERIRRIGWTGENVREMLGFSPEEVSERDWFVNNLHPEDRERVIAETHESLFGRGRVANEFRFRRRDGSYLWCRAELRLTRDATGRPVEAIGSWSDITERKQLEEQFRQAQKMEAVGMLAGGVAHDFNNLLTIISGYSELLLSELPPADPRREMISEIRQAGERAAGLTRQLLAFSRQTVLEPRVLDLNEVVRDNEKMLRRLIGEDVQLTTVLDPALSLVKVDPGQIGQVIMNLAVNARDAMPTGGKLAIKMDNVALDEASAAMDPDAKPGRYALLSVADTGTGMTPEVRAHVFEPFFTTKGPGKGTGLGLATVYGIVKQSGGFISVHSEPGRGTIFKVYFPAVEGRVATGKSFAGIKLLARGTETILLVEDEDAVRAMARLALQQAGYTVLEARRGAEAIRLADEHGRPIHLLVTDVVMPDMGGRELVECLVLRRPDLKVLYLSGYTDDAVVRHGVLQAEVAFLQKPFTLTALTNRVREVLDAAG